MIILIKLKFSTTFRERNQSTRIEQIDLLGRINNSKRTQQQSVEKTNIESRRDDDNNDD